MRHRSHWYLFAHYTASGQVLQNLSNLLHTHFLFLFVLRFQELYFPSSCFPSFTLRIRIFSPTREKFFFQFSTGRIYYSVLLHFDIFAEALGYFIFMFCCNVTPDFSFDFRARICINFQSIYPETDIIR